MPRYASTLWVAGFAMLLSFPAGAAESSDPATKIPGCGAATVPLRPTSLRLEIELRSLGKTSEMALSRLDQRKRSALSRLKKIAPATMQVTFSPPTVDRIKPRSDDEDHPGRRRRAQVLNPGAIPAPAAPQPAPAPAESSEARSVPRMMRAGSTLRVQWPLAAVPDERVVAVAATIKEKVAAADLAGSKRPQKLTREEEDALEELRTDGSDSLRRSHRLRILSRRTSGFVYVAAISERDRKDALARAFADAKRDAAELAETSGLRLGKLLSASRSDSADDPFMDEESDGRSPAVEITGGKAEDLVLGVQIEATFEATPNK